MSSFCVNMAYRTLSIAFFFSSRHSGSTWSLSWMMFSSFWCSTSVGLNMNKRKEYENNWVESFVTLEYYVYTSITIQSTVLLIYCFNTNDKVLGFSILNFYIPSASGSTALLKCSPYCPSWTCKGRSWIAAWFQYTMRSLKSCQWL